MADQSYPANLDAERSVLGAILLEPKAIYAVLDKVVADDFCQSENRVLFDRMVQFASEGKPIDQITLKADLERTGDLEKAGGIVYIMRLTDGMPRTSNAEHYAGLVKEKSRLRQIIRLCESGKAHAFNGEKPAREIGLALDKRIMAVCDMTTSQVRTSAEVVDTVYRQIEYKSQRSGEQFGIPTGFPKLDRITGGLHGGEFTVLAARPGMGKTAFALNMSVHAASKGKRVLVVSLEMSAEQLMQRIICAEGQVDSSRVRSGHLTADDWKRVSATAGVVSELPLMIDDSTSMTVLDLRARARRLAAERGLDLVVVDYLQLMSSPQTRWESRVQEVTAMTRGLKMLAKDLAVPVLVLSQLNRAIEQRASKHPQLSDLRESGSIEQDADTVMFIGPENGEEEPELGSIMGRRMNLWVAKQRNGPTGIVPLVFQGLYTRFGELAEENVQSPAA